MPDRAPGGPAGLAPPPLEAAPFDAGLAGGPEGGAAWWARAADGVRIRLGGWGAGAGAKDAPSGTVFLFPGRSEYVEKYGRTAAALRARGFAVLAADWRGQGLADRLHDDPALGHVNHFLDYQLDVAALAGAAAELGFPEPWFLLAHSMGGAIGLRALLGAHRFRAAVFSAPMWGIQIAPRMRPLAYTVPMLAHRIGAGARYAPSTGASSYLVEAPFEDNLLTTDPEMWDYMVAQVRAEPRFRLGGPSLSWLSAALAEMRALHAAPRPALPAHAAVGDRERIVDPAAIRRMMARWRDGRHEVVPGAEHELMMEAAPIREGFFDTAAALFRAAAEDGAP